MSHEADTKADLCARLSTIELHVGWWEPNEGVPALASEVLDLCRVVAEVVALLPDNAAISEEMTR